jgi:hypothetical protein
MAPEAKATQQSTSTTKQDEETATSGVRAKRAERQSPPVSGPRRTGLARLHQILRDPKAFREFRENLPAWIDEVGAFALILLGLLTFSALLNPTGDIAAPIASALRIAFGVGAFVIATAIVLLGVILLLVRVGFVVKLSWSRVLAFEVFFMTLQALLHLLTFADEPRALAREGEGGGYVGWAISSIAVGYVGEGTAMLIFAGIALFSLGAFFGIRRRDIRAVVLSFSDLLGSLANWLRPKPLAGTSHKPTDYTLNATDTVEDETL